MLRILRLKMINDAYWRRGSCYNIWHCLGLSVTPRWGQVSVWSQASGQCCEIINVCFKAYATVHLSWRTSWHIRVRMFVRHKCFWHTTNLAIDIFRVKLSFHIITTMWILQRLPFNTWSFLQSKLHFAEKNVTFKIHCTDCHSKMSHLLQSVGKEARKPPLRILEGDV